MVEASELDDIEPASASTRHVAGDNEVYVVSRRRGPVRIGYINDQDITAAATLLTDQEIERYLVDHRLPRTELRSDLLDERDERRRKAFDATRIRKVEAGARHRRRARELADGPTHPSKRRIGEIMAEEDGSPKGYDPRTVRRWLEDG